MSNKDNDAAAAAGCPVDHNARAAWLEKAAQAGSGMQAPHPLPPPPTTSAAASSSPSPSSAAQSTTSPSFSTSPPSPNSSPLLNLDREISTIPRAPISSAAPTPQPNTSSSPPSPLTASSTTTTPPPSSSQHQQATPPPSSSTLQTTTASHGSPSNSEHESGASASGNWVYPSERMFFDAMRRKRFDPEARDMRAIVPIHNAVNERAWAEIRAWEARFGWARAANAACQGPRLASFRGDSSKLTPRARWYALLGYQRPFDRHDWVVERCDGREAVEYVIDFYQGRGARGGMGGNLSFYLDVRPKLNSWEGCKMRLLGLLGW